MSSVAHLVRRAVGSLRNTPPGGAGTATAESVLNPAEFALWSTMDGRDRTHSLQVLSRLDRLAPGVPVEARAAALLHDVGKNESGLGWVLRVLATVVGPRGSRFAAYHRHEEIGARMLEGVSSPLTVDLVRGGGPDDLREALHRADEI